MAVCRACESRPCYVQGISTLGRGQPVLVTTSQRLSIYISLDNSPCLDLILERGARWGRENRYEEQGSSCLLPFYSSCVGSVDHCERRDNRAHMISSVLINRQASLSGFSPSSSRVSLCFIVLFIVFIKLFSSLFLPFAVPARLLPAHLIQAATDKHPEPSPPPLAYSFHQPGSSPISTHFEVSEVQPRYLWTRPRIAGSRVQTDLVFFFFFLCLCSGLPAQLRERCQLHCA
jgi:hypothetical protein